MTRHIKMTHPTLNSLYGSDTKMIQNTADRTLFVCVTQMLVQVVHNFDRFVFGVFTCRLSALPPTSLRVDNNNGE